MKHLLTVLMILAPFIAHSQYLTNRPEIINPVFESIVERGLQEGIQVDLILIGRLIEIEVVEETPRKAGAEVAALGGKKAKIYISEKVTKDQTSLEWILAHEIAHVIGVPHCCDSDFCVSIMSRYTSTDPSDLFYQMQGKPEHWKELFSHKNWHLLQSISSL